MSTRFRFDLENGDDTIVDEDGIEADSVDQAIEQAVAGLEDMRAGGELSDMEPGWHLVVRDGEGVEIGRIAI